MLFDFSKILTRFLGRLSTGRTLRKRRRPQTRRTTVETLEVRALLSGTLVSDVLTGTTDTAITGTVYEDVNSNGIKDGGEKGLAGWVMYLDLDGSGTLNTDSAGTQEPSAITDTRGDFTINRLAAGTYRVAEELQAGWTPTAAISRDVVVEARRSTRADFFNFAAGEIVGTVWNDFDNDGTQNPDGAGGFSEPGLAGWTIYLDTNSNLTLDAGEISTLTDHDGGYKFSHLPAGSYSVTEVLPEGWDPSRQNDVNKTVKVTALQTSVQNFGVQNLTNGAVQGVIWNDLNFDGVRATDPTSGAFTDPALAGWTVYLDLNENDALDADEPTAVSSADGTYSFLSVPEGNYHLVEVLPTRWSPTSGHLDQQIITVSAGSLTIAADFANMTVLDGGIQGTIWNDRFRDGVRDVTAAGVFLDPGLAGWEVYVDLNRNRIQDPLEPTAVTDAAGVYSFADLQVGNYDVIELLPAGWETTTGYNDAQTVRVSSGLVTTAGDFANFDLSTILPGTVSGTVWSDRNGNGIRDVSATTGAFTDPGLAGWVVFVDANSNGIKDAAELNATTDATGAYSITGINPGTVRILEVAPAGWRATAPLGGVRSIALKNGGAVSGLDFGNYAPQTASIAGTVYSDLDKDGLRDPGERGLAGVTVYLDTNDNGALDPDEQQIATSGDLFYTPTVDEAGTWSFTHLPEGPYTVRTILPDLLSGTPLSERTHAFTLGAAEARTGVDTAAQFRRNEIHGSRFDDVNGNHVRDAGESAVPGAVVYLDLDRDNVQDVDEPTTTTGDDGSYSFVDLGPGAYVVRDRLSEGEEHTYPLTTSGTLWPAGTSNPAVGNVTPTSITTSLAAGATHRETVTLTLPDTGALTRMVDVFLLFDDTGSFTGNSPIVRAAFPTIISQLQSSLPGIDLGFGVGRFEEYGNYAFEYSTGRPFILNQPIVAASTPGYLTAIQAALNRTTPGYGGDGPETDIEALYQLVTGVGFDGNNNGSVLDSGAAGLASTQLNPGASGDVPSFASFMADTANSVMAPAGNVGGGGFRAGALPIILTATDIGFAYQPKGETVVNGVGGVSLPVTDLTGTSRPTTPFGAGAGLQETVTALNSLGALVIGLGTNAASTTDPRRGLEALSKLTGAVNRSTTSIANGTLDPIDPGDPLYFQIASGFGTSVSNGVVNAIQNAVTNVAVDVTLKASDPRVRIINHTGTIAGIGSGQTASFDVEFIGDGVPHRFDLQFVRAGTNVVMGSIPVVIGTPIPGDGYEFEDLAEGEIHHSVDFGSRSIVGSGNQSPTNLTLSATSIAENAAAGSVVGTLATVDPNAGDSFQYSLVAGDVSAFTIVGNELRTIAPFDFEALSSYSVTLRTTDAGGLTFDRTFAISVTNVNEAPSDLSLSGDSIAENLPAGTNVGTLASVDPDAAGSFSYSLVAGDVAAFTIVGDQLRTVAGFDFETQASYSVTVRTTDAGGLTFDRTFAISILDVGGLPPVLTLPTTPVIYSENTAATALNLTATVTDADPTSYNLGQLTIVWQSGVQADDRISIRHQGLAAGQIGLSGNNVLYSGAVIGTWSGGFTNNSPVVITLNAGANTTSVAALLRNILFQNVGDNPTATTRTLAIALADGLGEVSSIALRDVTVTPINDLPVLTKTAGATAYAENDPAVIVDSGLTVADVDSPNFDLGSLKASFGAGSVSTDRLVILHQGTAAGQIGLSGNSVLYGGVAIGTYAGGFTTSGPLTITLNADASPDAVQALARQIGYLNAGDNPTTATRTVNFVAVDGDGGTSLTVAKQITVTVTNDAPLITPTATITTFVENGVAKAIDTGIKVVDADSANFDGGVLVVQLAGGGDINDRLSILNGGTAAGRIGVTGNTVTYGGIAIGTFTGGFLDNSPLSISLNSRATVAAVNALVKGVAFQTLGDTPVAGTRVAQFTLSDGDGATSLAATKSIAVSAVNDLPVVALSAGQVAYTENAPAVVIDSNVTVNDLDSLDFAGGTLRVSFTAGAVSTDRLAINHQGTGAGEIGLSGNTVLLGGVPLGTYAGGFTSSGTLTITLNSSATPAAVQALARQITYRNAGDNPTEALRTISFVVTDGDGGTSVTATRQIAVTAMNDASVVGGLGSTVSYTEGGAAVVVASAATVTDPDSANFDGGALTISLPQGASLDDLLEIRNVGVAAGQIGVNLNDVTYGGVVIGSFAGGTAGSNLVVTFNTNATAAAVQALLRNVTFRVNGAVTANSIRKIRFSLTDGDGGLSSSVEKQINVVNLP